MDAACRDRYSAMHVGILDTQIGRTNPHNTGCMHCDLDSHLYWINSMPSSKT